MPTNSPCWPPRGAHTVHIYSGLPALRTASSYLVYVTWMRWQIGQVWETEVQNLERFISRHKHRTLMAMKLDLERLPSKHFVGGPESTKDSNPAQQAALCLEGGWAWRSRAHAHPSLPRSTRRPSQGPQELSSHRN